MSNFTGFMDSRRTQAAVERISHLMVQKNVDPDWYIGRYLEAMDSEDGLICEGWVGNFFRRIGNAWRGFWKDPNPQETPSTRLEAAKKALQELVRAVQQNQGAEANVLGTVLRGLEQSLSIIDRVEEPLRKAEPRIKQFQAAQQSGVAVAFMGDPSNRLPDDLHARFEQIMHRRNALVGQPDSEQKLKDLVKNDDELLAFRQEIEDKYQSMHPRDQAETAYKERIKTFLTRIHTDATFREIESLLDFARQRSGTGTSVTRPNGYEEVVQAWRGVAAAVADPAARKQRLIAWYQALPPNHGVKAFIHTELQETPGVEQDLFWKYAQEWISKLPHYLGTR